MAKGIKTGGRKPGSLNKRTKAEAACHKFNLDPFEMLCEMARNAEQESNRLAAISKLCAHIEPPRKPLEVAIDPEKNAIRIIVEDYTKS